LRAYVIDASVAIRFLLVEDLSEKAQQLLRDFLNESVDMRAPDLIQSEVGNALWKAVKRKLMELSEALAKLTYFHKLKINSVQLTEHDLVDALGWAVKNDATYYDSLYVRSSEVTGSTLLTADDELFKKASGTVATLHLRDLKLTARFSNISEKEMVGTRRKTRG
jgi:predicted nucleic acid-binding protein